VTSRPFVIVDARATICGATSGLEHHNSMTRHAFLRGERAITQQVIVTSVICQRGTPVISHSIRRRCFERERSTICTFRGGSR